MKTTSYFVGCFLASCAIGLSQAAAPTASYIVGERTLNSREWLRVSQGTNDQGAATLTTNRAYVELATGMHYRDATGKLVESTEEIEIVPGGAIARHGQHQVSFAGNLNLAAPISLQTPDGKTLKSRILGLAYFDTATGTNVLIAEIKNCEGEIHTPNVVLYPDAFTDFKADVRYTYTRAGFEQDIILREQPPGPEEWGLNPETTQLQVLTEFISPPEPVVRANPPSEGGASADQSIDFGTMNIGRGRAFTMGEENTPRKIQVTKEWAHEGARTFLVEGVRLRAITNSLRGLPIAQRANTNTVRHVASATRVLPSITSSTESTEMRLAQTPMPKNGLVLDYLVTLSSGGTSYTFQGDTTYYVSGAVTFTGNVIFEGGTVLKYDPIAATYVFVNGGSLTFQTTPYRPAVFTSKNDSSVGETIPGSSGPPTIDSQNYYLATMNLDADVHDIQMKYCYCGFNPNWGNVVLRDAQFVHAAWPVYVVATTTCAVRNVLMHDITAVALEIGYATVRAEHLTVNGCFAFGQNDGSAALNVTNSLLVAVANWGMPFTSVNNSTNNSAEGVFQTVVAGKNYLVDNSPYRNAGTTNINAALQAELKTKTTYPPIYYANTALTSDTSFRPQAQRDTDIPDLGYHYDPLDYIFSNVTLSAVITLANGVALGISGSGTNSVSGCAVYPQDGAGIVSVGLPQQMNRIVSFENVQEQWLSAGEGGFLLFNSGSDANRSFQFRFTDFSVGQGFRASPFVSGYGLGAFNNIIFRDCRLRAATLSGNMVPWGGNMLIGLTNNLMERCDVGFTYYYYGGSYYGRLNAYNNLFWNGTFSIGLHLYQDYYNQQYIPGGWNVRDNLFHSTSQTLDLDSTGDYNLNRSNNGFTTGTTDSLNGPGDITSVTANYQTGVLGNYYLPPSSPLINRGSRTADQAGLYHFTTQVNEVCEAATQVDIGYHYVATSCGPIDTIYVEDSIPTGGSPGYDGGDSWSWVTSNPTPFSASKSSQSNIGSGEHQHYFYNASSTMVVNTGDSLIAYVYLDPTYTPTEVMLQWHIGSTDWEHRAYWGANSITFGVNGTNSRRYIGSLPSTGGWVRLEVPASQVGLEGATVNGVAFTLYNGRATWDYAGKKGGNLCYDTDGDGTPDNVEDANGNGSVDSGETDPTNANDLGLGVWITEPKRNAVLP